MLGLGDVYLGAPVATPLDPRHRLVTTKYNPARTWTAENSVGIGGAYLCIYGMEGPGGYQFVGRTTQVWSRWQQRGAVRAGHAVAAALLRPDQVVPGRAPRNCSTCAPTWPPGRLRAARSRTATFSLAEHERFLAENADSIAAFRARQGAAFAAEREAWEAAGEFDARRGGAAARGRRRPSVTSRAGGRAGRGRVRRVASGRSTSRPGDR